MARTATMKHAWDQYTEWRLGYASSSTVAGEAVTLQSFVSWAGTDRVVSDLSAELVEDWWKSTEPLAASTRATRLAQLRAFLSYCRECGWMFGDPTALIRAAAVRPTDRIRYSADQLLALLEAAKTPRDRAVIAVGINLALRGGEIARIRVKDLDLEGGTLRVRIDKTNETDDMPISADLDLELRRWVTHYLHVCPTAGREDFLFPAQHATNNRITYKPAKQIGEPYLIVKRALEALGHPSDQEGVHTLRRSVATIYFDLIEADGSFDSALLATMTLLHHSRPETTLRYIGRDRQKLARDQLLRGKPFLSKLATPAGTGLRVVS